MEVFRLTYQIQAITLWHLSNPSNHFVTLRCFAEFCSHSQNIILNKYTWNSKAQAFNTLCFLITLRAWQCGECSLSPSSCELISWPVFPVCSCTGIWRLWLVWKYHRPSRQFLSPTAPFVTTLERDPLLQDLSEILSEMKTFSFHCHYHW